MQDRNWELINGEPAHEIEYINHVNTVNVIEALLILYISRIGTGPNGCHAPPTARILLELHRTATLFLLTDPGIYRQNYNVEVSNELGEVAYTAPPWEEVPAHMESFHKELEEMWPTADAISVTAFALWKINWVHPFRNGNGRSARAFAYACLCLKIGIWLPGSETVIDLIMKNRDPYEVALRAADESYRKAGQADLASMREYVMMLLAKQLSSIS
jgi:Fic family protein